MTKLMPIAEIARRLGTSVDDVQQTLENGLSKIRAYCLRHPDFGREYALHLDNPDKPQTPEVLIPLSHIRRSTEPPLLATDVEEVASVSSLPSDADLDEIELEESDFGADE